MAMALPAHAQVAGRQLLSWCEGALGGSVTATFDAFQCEAYLQAVIDREAAEGTDLASCLGTAQPTAGDLMARIVPEMRRAAESDPESLSGPAHAFVGGWIAANCDRPEPGDAGASPVDPQIELAIWQGTQRIDSPDARIAALEQYLEDFPEGRFAALARLQLEDLRADAAEDGEPEAPPDDPAPDDPAPDEPAPDEPAPDEPAPAGEPPGGPELAASAPDPPPAPPAADPAPPRYEDTLTAAERRQIQRALRNLGLYRLGIDGVFGNGTRRGIRAFQAAAGNPQTGYLTEEEVALLLSLSAGAPRAHANAASITVRNVGNSAIVAIYASPTSSPNWEANHLGNSLLLPNTEYRVALSNRGTCRFDVRVVDEKNMSREYWNLNACGHMRLTFP
jgi:hypothetical protein